MILRMYHFNQSNLYQIANSKTKNSVNTYIEEMKDKGLLTGYFGLLAKNIYGRTRVKNCEVLELLIYGAYREEQSKLEKTELNLFKDVADYYYQQGQEEVNEALNKKRKVSVMSDAFFLALLEMPNAKGYTWKQYVEAIIKYNADQIYRQCVINIQQNKENKIDDDIFQNIIKKQQNAKLCVNGDKISGDVDLMLIGLNNQAKIEGMTSIDKNAEVVFISDMCEHVTDMCSYMNGMRFKVNGENEFDRYYGETQKELKIVRIKCKGLVLGVNLPPISHHFHYCHSTIQYARNRSVQKVILTEDEGFWKSFNINKFVRKDITYNKEKLIKNAFKNEEIRKIALNNDIKKIYIYGNKSKHKANEIYFNAEWQNKSKSLRERTLRHEVGHAIDYKFGYISSNGELLTALNIDKQNILEHEKQINFALNTTEYIEYSELSDIIGGMTNNKIKGRAYHENKYWERENALEKETFANLFSIAGSNNIEYLNIINRYLPNTLNVFEELIRRIK